MNCDATQNLMMGYCTTCTMTCRKYTEQNRKDVNVLLIYETETLI